MLRMANLRGFLVSLMLLEKYKFAFKCHLKIIYNTYFLNIINISIKSFSCF